MTNPADILRLIEQATADLNRFEGKHEALKKEVMAKKKELRDLLGCDKGQEKGALKELREKVKQCADEMTSLMKRAGKARDGAKK